MTMLRTPKAPMILTALGVLPFLAPAGLMVFYRHDAIVLNTLGLWLLVYAAVILSFLGGVRWGVEILKREKPRLAELIVSVLGSLMGWIAVIAYFRFGSGWLMAAMAGALLVYYVLDRGSPDMPHWYRRLRIWPTVAAIICLLLACVLLG